MDWFKTFHGAPTDPKLGIIAQRTGVARPVVIALWWYVLDDASKASVRGKTRCSAATADEAAYAIGADEGDVLKVFGAFVERGLIADDGTVVAWEKRQAGKHDLSTGRVKAYRERQKVVKKQDVPAGNGNETDETDETAFHVSETHETDETPLEEKRVEKKEGENPPLPPLAQGELIPVEPKAKGPKRATPIPDGFPDTAAMSEAMNMWDANDRADIDPDQQAEWFRDWVADKGITSKSWEARWRNWCRKAMELTRRGHSSTGRSALMEAAMRGAGLELAD